ncbi:MAG: hypothetical protein AVDCRST_MAG06-3026, partial [uncultured Nocardioides sp.]
GNPGTQPDRRTPGRPGARRRCGGPEHGRGAAERCGLHGRGDGPDGSGRGREGRRRRRGPGGHPDQLERPHQRDLQDRDARGDAGDPAGAGRRRAAAGPRPQQEEGQGRGQGQEGQGQEV